MAWSKTLSKGTSKNKSIESTNSNNNLSGAITTDKSVQSTNAGNILTTNNEAADNKSTSLSNGRSNLLFYFIHSSFIDVM